ncbi:MAG: hypothetical protein LBN38_04600 [Verrucomicrobiota bacterium]|jgi:hypothetical protein|nr:hypothetical protein [Verrucomicrobiota bacterium]
MLFIPCAGFGEAILQFFNASWNEIAEKVPELAEAGYTSIWLPPPAKATGGYSVGYDLVDPFDLGGRDQRGSVSTRYGTEADLHNLVETLHRFGMRVYFDNIMNHRAYDVPGYNESTPVDVFPGMVAEDFHLRKTSDGFYRKWDNTRDWQDAWQVLHLGLSDLLDIAHETPNQNFGVNEGDWHAKPSIVRHPLNPEFYDRMPNTNAPMDRWNPWDWSGDTNANLYVGFGRGNGLTAELIERYPDFFKEDVGAYLLRAARWMVANTKADGLRLDAVKHVPDYFFGKMDGEDKDASNEGYIGNIQWQFNMTHGYSDWGNHRDTVFNENAPRDDALVFGEHLGSPPGYDGYIAAGMRLVDNDLRNQLNWRFSAKELTGYDHAGAGGFAPGVGIMHAQSHDNDYVDRKELHHAYYYLREGIGLLYTDGNTHAATLSGSGGAFPRWADTAFLGQWGQTHIPELLSIHQNFAWGGQNPVWSDGSCVAWERGGTGDWASMLVVFNSEWETWRTIPTSGTFPAVGGGAYGTDAYLYNYARTYTPHVPGEGWPAVDYSYASALTSVEIPPNSYTVWGYKNPDPSRLWPGDVMTFYDDGEIVDTILVDRKDGPDGDPAFNPHGLPDEDETDYTYSMPIPRITKGTNVTFGVRLDGSAANLLLRLDGGMDLNGLQHEGGDWRDHPPALADDRYLGFEECVPFFTQRIWPEKFAAVDTLNCWLGSEGATSYQVRVGEGEVTHIAAAAENDFSENEQALAWVYHDPAGMTDSVAAQVEGIPSASRGEEDGNEGSPPVARGSIFGSSGYVYIGEGPGNAVWYSASDFNGRSLGTVASLKVGGEISTDKVWDSSASMGYEIRQGAAVVAGPSDVAMEWAGESGSGDKWQVPAGVELATGLADGAYTLHIWFRWREGGSVEHYDSNGGANYVASFVVGEGGEDPEPPTPGILTNQFIVTSSSIVIWAKMPKRTGTATWLYFTEDGMQWPEGAGGYPANPATRVVRGAWQQTGADGDSDWWMFEIPRPLDGTLLRYKIGAARRQGTAAGWDPVWPGSAHDIYRKQIMLTQWMATNQNLKTKSYHTHNDYNSWTTNGLLDGFHFLSARAFLKRENGAPIYNTFRQTFYLDTETPRGYLQYPAAAETQMDGSEYGLIVRTDPTVREVWYHITDTSTANDGPGNGLDTNGVVTWAKASLVTAWNQDMAEDTAFPKVWRFVYSRIPPTGTATLRIRLREWSSGSPTNWSASNPAADDALAGHYTEITKVVQTRGDAENFYFDWPTDDGAMVEAGWRLRLKYTSRMVSGLSNEEIFDKMRVYVNVTANGSTNRGDLVSADTLNFENELDWGSGGEGENLLSFEMPNVYNGQNNWLYGIRVEFDNSNSYGTFSKAATRLVQHRGPLLPTLIISTPPETDSDGAKYIIQMKDLPPDEIAADPTLRQTPIVVLTDDSATNLVLRFTSPAGYEGDVVLQSVTTNGNKLSWTYTWTVARAGAYRFEATVWADTAGTELSVSSNVVARNATVQFRQLVPTDDAANLDWDDDGIANASEENTYALPASNDELWTQEEVFRHHAHGKTRSNSPDTDGDGLPDGLELGFRRPMDGVDTDAEADTNGDGWPNFMPDLDPPFYNTTDNIGKVPGVDAYGTGADRTKLVRGSVSDPNNTDHDYDGLPDALEDANRNGWVDGDGKPIPPDWDPWLERAWPNGRMTTGETWEETSPNVADSDGDGQSDGYGEDLNLNGRTDMFLVPYEGAPKSEWIELLLSESQNAVFRAGSSSNLYSRSVHYAELFMAYSVDEEVFAPTAQGPGSRQTNGWPRLVMVETDPLNADSDGDGLPDGWEVRYGLDPLDNGIYGFRTGGPGNPQMGADGNPDGDTYLDAAGQEKPYTNLLEYQNGTNPTVNDSVKNPGGEGQITIGQGHELGSINGAAYHTEFTEWTLDDLLALDDYNQGGNSSDIYRYNEFDSSRDMVTFYFRDGGSSAAGGDDKLYFRVDFDDLKAYAEGEHLNIYVAINFGNYGVGELNFPDEVDAGSYMRWNACVGVYDSANGVLYVDQNPSLSTDTIGGDLQAAGVVAVPGGYFGAYFNSELDAVAFAVDRRALLNAGWTGDPDALLFQVYTTRDHTGNSGGEGGGANPGDNGGRNDFADTIGDDWLTSDYYADQDYISRNSYYRYCIGRDADKPYTFNHLGRHAKVALLMHGNQAVEPGSTIQNIVNNGEGAGYQRPIKIHNIYSNAPLNLHITPTLAMALEWAEVGTSNIWFSGPALNQEIRNGISNGTFRLLASTYSDHILRYFDQEYNLANTRLAQDILNGLYGGTPSNPVVSTNVFWAPERVLDLDSLKKVHAMGYQATILDQNTHLFHWYGRGESLGNNAYKLNRLWLESPGGNWPSIKAFVIANAADSFRYVNTDSGLPRDLRRLFNRRARSGGDQVSTIFYMWEELAQSNMADAYDKNLRWMANHPWIQLVALDDVLDGETVDHDVTSAQSLQAHDWIQHASNENYDNWYDGSPRHEGLAPKMFEIRPGTNMPLPYGSMTNGVLSNTWRMVRSIVHPDVRRLAQQTLFASTFEIAFHQEANNNLERWSYGKYIYPATDWVGLQGFAWRAQGQTRRAAVYAAVDDWAGRILSDVEVVEADLDLDGENEYILRNNRVMALFERSGGRMIGAWLKNGTNVYQMIGNFVSMPDSGSEEEGAANVTEDGRVAALRSSALKDWWDGTTNQVNALYAATPGSRSITFDHNGVSKSIRLDLAATNTFVVEYAMQGKTLYVRNGLSPDLDTLLQTGQKNLLEENESASGLHVKTVRPGSGMEVGIALQVSTGTLKQAATDQTGDGSGFNTVKMRNQAQTRQVELVGTNALAFQLSFTAQQYDPPTLTFQPPGPYILPVGSTGTFTVAATDQFGAALPIAVEGLPLGSTFDDASGIFRWAVTNLSRGGRVSDSTFSITFSATDGSLPVSDTAEILVPWDENGNDMGDDWEFISFAGDMSQRPEADYDEDGFANHSEWVAGTDPTSPGDYIGWESLYMAEDGDSQILNFLSVRGRTYRIEISDANEIVTNHWWQVDVVVATSNRTQWVDTNYPAANSNRMYRIVVPRM